MLLVIKAKLEAVESGITTLESEFLANIVLPDGGTVGERVACPTGWGRVRDGEDAADAWRGASSPPLP